MSFKHQSSTSLFVETTVSFSYTEIGEGTTADLYFGAEAGDLTNKFTGIINRIQIQFSITNDLTSDENFFFPDGECMKLCSF
jgi:hypothetical protein